MYQAAYPSTLTFWIFPAFVCFEHKISVPAAYSFPTAKKKAWCPEPKRKFFLPVLVSNNYILGLVLGTSSCHLGQFSLKNVSLFIIFLSLYTAFGQKKGSRLLHVVLSNFHGTRIER